MIDGVPVLLEMILQLLIIQRHISLTFYFLYYYRLRIKLVIGMFNKLLMHPLEKTLVKFCSLKLYMWI